MTRLVDDLLDIARLMRGTYAAEGSDRYDGYRSSRLALSGTIQR